MRVVSLLAHPRADSFCHALSARARQVLADRGCDVQHHDLYAENFDPCLRAEEAYSIGQTLEQALSNASDPVLRAHRAQIAAADGLLVVHPNWWGKPPAILAGWLDRVLVPGVAYRLAAADGLPEGLLTLRHALILNTADTPAQRERDDIGDPLDLIWGRSVLPFCGVTTHHRRMFSPVVDSTADDRRLWLDEAASLTRTTFA